MALKRNSVSGILKLIESTGQIEMPMVLKRNELTRIVIVLNRNELKGFIIALRSSELTGVLKLCRSGKINARGQNGTLHHRSIAWRRGA